MKKLNLHGLKIRGIKNASGNTINWNPRSGGYNEIFYDRATGDVWTVAQISFGRQNWTEYHDPNVIRITTTDRHMTMQQIANAIWDIVTYINATTI